MAQNSIKIQQNSRKVNFVGVLQPQKFLIYLFLAVLQNVVLDLSSKFNVSRITFS